MPYSSVALERCHKAGQAGAVVRQAGKAGQACGGIMRVGAVAISSGLQWKKRSGGCT